MTHTKTVIEYFYSAHSAFAYLGACELERISKDSGWKVVHRPFDFWPVVRAVSGRALGTRSAAHISYFFGRELSRWAQWRNLPILGHRPTHHDNTLVPASCMILAASDPGRLSFAMLQAHWRDDADIANPATLNALATSCGEDASALHIRATSLPIHAQFQANTTEAIARGIFGSPTYFVRGDMFYGQDRLEMVERAIKHPFEP